MKQPKDKATESIKIARKVTGWNTKTVTEKHIADTFNNAPSHDERNYEAEYAKEVMLHAVTKFELKEAMATIERLKSDLDAIANQGLDARQCMETARRTLAKVQMPSCQPLPDKAPKCPKCGFVMCEQFDERPVTAIASVATPNGNYICYRCKITKGNYILDSLGGGGRR